MRPGHISPIPMALLVIACNGDLTRPVLPEQPPEPPPVQYQAVGGAASTTGTPPAIAALLDGAFAFLQPLPPGEARGEFDPTVLPVLAVEVCVPHLCDAGPLHTYTSTTGPGAQTIRLDEKDQHFIVNWMPADLGLPSPAVYRIRVLAAGLVLGHVDVHILSNGSDLKRADTGEALALLDRRTLPVKFSVRQNPVISAWLSADGGASADDVARLLVTEFGSAPDEVAAVLAFIGYSAADVAGVLKDVFGFGPADAIGLLMAVDLVTGTGDAADALDGAGYSLVDIVVVLRDVFGQSAAQIVPVLKDIGADPVELGTALVDELGETLTTIAALLDDNGYDPDTIFDTLVRMGELAGDPLGTALGAGMAIMRGLGYHLDNFRDALHGYAQEHLIEGLGLSGYSIAELTDFMLNVMDLTVAVLMDRMEDWGVPLAELVDALVDAGAAVDDIVAGAIAAYDAAAEAVAGALAEAGAAALEIGSALMEAYDQTVEEMAAVLRDVGFQAEVVFDAVFRRLQAIAADPAEFPIALAMAVMKGLGYAFHDFSDALRAYLQDNFIDVLEGMGLSGFSLGELAGFMVHVMGLTTERMAEIAERWGVPVSEFISALASAGVAMDEIATWAADAYDLTAAQLAAAMKAAGQQVAAFADALIQVYGLTEAAAVAVLEAAGYLAEDVGDWLFHRFAHLGDAGFELAATLLTQAGYAFDKVAAWVWLRAGGVASLSARVLRAAGHSAGKVANFLVNVVGRPARAAFDALKQAGYTAAETAEAIYLETGASIVAIGGWLQEFHELGAGTTLEILHDLGASLTDLITVLIDVFSATLEDATQLLLGLDYTLDQIIAAWGT